MATYEVPISQFPGAVAPDSFEEFIGRVKADGGIGPAVISPELKYSDFGVAPKIKLYFNSALDAGEETVVDGLAAAAPGLVSSSTSSWLSDSGGEGYRGAKENLTAATTTAGGPSVRMNEDYELAGGVYVIRWNATVYGTASSTDYTARFILDRGGGDEFIAPFTSEAEGERIFHGFTVLALPEAELSFEMEIEKIGGGGGSAGMKLSRFSYQWVGPA